MRNLFGTFRHRKLNALEYQQCPCCDVWRPIQHYSPARSWRYGSWCSACIRERDAPRKPQKRETRVARRAFRQGLRFGAQLAEGW